jgi:hypothetical protein
LVLFGAQVQAFEPKPCATFSNTNDVIECMFSNHPDVRKTEADQRDIEGLRKSGEQIPNPILSFDTSKAWSYNVIKSTLKRFEDGTIARLVKATEIPNRRRK